MEHELRKVGTRLPTRGWRLAQATLIWVVRCFGRLRADIAAAATSPLLAWRGPVYILAGFAGIVGLGIMLFQPLLIGGYMPGLSGRIGRRAHLWLGGALVAAVVIHVGGLWITSPPDMIDALLLTSPTPFSPFGVIAMWAIFAVALLAVLRRRLRPRTWRIAHVLARDRHCRMHRGSWHADRGRDGDGHKGGALRAGPCGGHKSHRRPVGVEKAEAAARIVGAALKRARR